MKKFFAFAVVFLFCFSFSSEAASLFDDVIKGIGSPAKGKTDDDTVISGLKEALSIGTESAVKQGSQVDGYFGNKMIKILMPEKLQKVSDVLGKIGYQKEVDEFILSMNRAAEKAVPKAASIFGNAIKQMTFEDARKIFSGGNTAATDYFKEKTHAQLYQEFRPIISTSLDEVGSARAYKEMMGKYESPLPFIEKPSLDLDHYVTNKTLDGLFYMVGQEEKKIRTDPAARVTDLLKTVFGK